MSQESAWEKEYANPTFLTKDIRPQSDTVRFVKVLKKDGFFVDGSHILDLGCGTGRNSQYFAGLGAHVTGIEISSTALTIAKEYAKTHNLNIVYKKQSMATVFPVPDNSQDIVLDVTSSNSLTEAEREVYISEVNRVLKKGGYVYMKALCKEGDDNAKKLLKQSPGKEKDTYVLPEVGVIERVWDKNDLLATYSPHFKILYLEKKTTYTHMAKRLYKRNFWICHMQK